ncbi:MAG: DUF3090 family protein [Dehalococcoidia bacterium]|nr:DUF3090 family protein [Dehalococcoidia bacterium]
MAERREFGELQYIAAEAIGQPGQRRFRLRAMNQEGETAFLWLEKEQLNALGDAIQTVLRDERYDYAPLAADDAGQEPVFPLEANVDFRVGQLSMGVNQSVRRIVLIGAEAVASGDEAEGLQMEFDYRRGFELQRQIAAVVAAGRPPCPLCGGPLDPQGHVCPRSNGHHPAE